MIGIDFGHPLALLLLLLIPAFVLIDRWGVRMRSGARRYTLLAIRLIGFSLIVLALAAPLIWTGTDQLSTVFLLDRSASVSPAAQQDAVNWIESAIHQKQSTDRAAVVSFAGDAAVEQGLTQVAGPIAPNAQLDRNHTNINAALRLAEGVLPQSGARRIVLLSDGNQNQGNALTEAPTLRAAGIPVDVVPITDLAGPEVALRQLNVPPSIHQNERFSLSVTVDSTTDTTGRLQIVIDGRLDSTQNVDLHQGQNNIVIAHAPLTPGLHTFQAVIEAQNDTLAENNVGYATLQVGGPPRILLVEGTTGNAKYLAPALRAGGLSVDITAPTGVGGDVATLRQYDAIGLINVAASQFGSDALTALKSYVQDFGGGLIAIGGDNSFGVGGYRGTPLEDVLPVSMDVRGRQSQANVALILVIDTSGSMSEGPTGATKIELARQAAQGAISELGPQDQLGIVAFDETPRWIAPTQFVTNLPALQTEISKLEPGGGTEIYPALQTAFNDISTRQAKIKHILLMTDGLSPSGDYEGLTAQMRAQGVTLSTIAIGTDADANFLQNLANLGRGRFYNAVDPVDVPRFVLKETTIVARAAVTEETFTPKLVDQTPVLSGITTLPLLRGYVATSPKPSAVVGLVSPEQDPILAQWQYGLGRSVAFTSDATAGWSADWVTWKDFSQFWTQTFKWVVPAPQSQNLQVQVAPGANSQATIQVDAFDASGKFVENATTTATVANPNGGNQKVALTQIAPGRYTGKLPIDQQGNYLVQVTQTAPGQSSPVNQVYGFTVPYSPEFAGQPTNTGFLHQLAQDTNGSVLTNPAESFAHDLRPADSALPIWPYLIGALVPLFLLDVAVRRLRFSMAALSPVLQRVRARWQGPTGRAASLANRLTAARRVSQSAPRPAAHPAPLALRRTPASPLHSPPVPRPPGLAQPSPARSGPARAPVVANGPAGSRLLAAKRRATSKT